MPTIIFRDDDTSYFTAPARLEALYGRVWAAGLPVCLAVIPWIYGDTRVYWSAGNPHDPGIPPEYRGDAKNFSIGDNHELCAYLNDKAAAGLVEICLHGYTHTFYEFITHDRALIRRKLDAGMALLERAIPAGLIQTFIPPYDRISPVALEELVARGFNISTKSLNLAPVPQLPQISGFAAARNPGGAERFSSVMTTSSHTSAIRRNHCAWRGTALARNDLTIVGSHYWTFYPSLAPAAESAKITPPGMPFLMRR